VGFFFSQIGENTKQNRANDVQRFLNILILNPFIKIKRSILVFPPSSTEPLTRSPLEDSLTVLLLVQSVLEVMRFVLAGMAIVTSLAGVRPGNLVIQIGLHVRMSISLKFDSIGNHQTLRDRNDILNKAIAQA
jgi:hypothetical protein